MSQLAVVCLLWERFAPILETFLAENKGTTVLTLSPYGAQALTDMVNRHGGSVVILENLLDDGERQAVQRQAVALRALREEYLQGSEWKNRAGAWGGNAEGLAEIVRTRAEADVPHEVLVLEALEKAAKLYQIRLTMVIEDFTALPKTAVLWSKKRNIPTLHFLHGVALAKPYTVHATLLSDVLAVYGERSIESQMDVGIDPSRCRIVGNPIWDHLPGLASRRGEFRQKLNQKYGLVPDSPVVTFATSWAANLSAVTDEGIFGFSVRAFLAAVKELKDQGICLNAVIKDRPPNRSWGAAQVEKIAASIGLSKDDYCYALEDIDGWLAASDLVVGVDSNILVEGLLASTPVINLIAEGQVRLGPSFDADSGVVEVEPQDLCQSILRILGDVRYRESLQSAMRASAHKYNLGVDGKASQRLAHLMGEMIGSRTAGDDDYVWRKYLDVGDIDATQYHNWARTELVGMFLHPPRKALDIGCAAGATGAYIKKQYPQAKVYGVELNRAAAEQAAKKLDGVFIGKFEDFDFESYGITPGSLDTVIVADVLEHIYNPWDVLVRLKPYLSPDAQVVASIPNTRNLAVMNDLANGNWTYEPWGLLDVTHIRFFTLKEIRRFFHETGYRVTRLHHNLDARLADIFYNSQNKPLFNIEFDKMVMKNVNQDELAELCTIQFYVVAQPGAVEKEVFEAQEQVQAAETEKRTVYQVWREQRQLTKVQGDLFEQRMEAWPFHPKIHLAVIAHPADGELIGQSVQSLADQYYYNVHISVVATAAAPASWANNDRLDWHQATETQLLDEVNRVLATSDAHWVGVVDAGDRLVDHSLLYFAEAGFEHPHWRVIYSDEDSLMPDGKYDLPHFKPDFNLDMLRSYPYVGGLLLVQRGLYQELGGFNPARLGVEDFDLVLRAFEAAGKDAIGHLPGVMYHRKSGGGHCRRPVAELVEAGRLTVEGHLGRVGVAAKVVNGLFPGSYRVEYQHEDAPLVSIVIAVRDQLDKVQRCIESILNSTHYPNYEILLVDNNSQSPEARAYLDGINALGEERLRVYTLPLAATLPQLHNVLLPEAKGDYLLFMHYDCAALQPDWLDGLMAHGRRPEVGAVAPRLLLPDGKIRQTGLVLGMDGATDTVYADATLDFPGYFGRAHLEQNFSALGGGCLLVNKAAFAELGGFDEQYAADYAEADLCLRLGGQGKFMVWTPFVSLLSEGGAAEHFPSPDTGRTPGADREVFLTRWLPSAARDPAYNVNLCLARGSAFEIETRAPLVWDPLPWRPLPRILAQPADNMGCGEYRIYSPMRALNAAGKVQGWTDYHIYTPAEMMRLDVDSIILQRQTEPKQIEAIARHKKFSRAMRVFELDDLLTHLPAKSIHNETMPKDVAKLLRTALSLCDRFVVSTEPLADAFKEYHSDIRVVPNFIEGARWDGLVPLRGQSDKPRVGWAGGIGHTGDLEIVADVIKALSQEVDWVFMGMCPDSIRHYVKEFHPGVPVDQYPAKLASLNLDLAIAPLEIHPFNEGKSNLRLLEYGVLGYPVVCTDIYPYRGDYPVTRVKNRYQDWVNAIRAHTADLKATAKKGDELREYIKKNWMLEDNLDLWLKAWLP